MKIQYFNFVGNPSFDFAKLLMTLFNNFESLKALSHAECESLTENFPVFLSFILYTKLPAPRPIGLTISYFYESVHKWIKQSKLQIESSDYESCGADVTLSNKEFKLDFLTDSNLADYILPNSHQNISKVLNSNSQSDLF